MNLQTIQSETLQKKIKIIDITPMVCQEHAIHFQAVKGMLSHPILTSPCKCTTDADPFN